MFSIFDPLNTTVKLATGFSLKDVGEAVKNFKEGNYVSSITDALRASPIFDIPLNAVKNGAKAIWQTGAEFYLRKKNYDFSADLLEHALNENPSDLRYDNDSDIAKKLKEDSTLKNKVKALINNPNEKTSIEFNSGDLFYSIHKCSVEITNIEKNNDNSKDITVHLHDTYNFTEILSVKGDDKPAYDFGFANTVNDAATITTLFDALNPYEVDIYLTINSKEL